MNVISRIRFPSTLETSSLYIKCNENASLNLNPQNVEVVLKKNGVLSFNTYFNSFYEKFYTKYTNLSSLYYLLKLEGDFQVSLYREHYQKDGREIIYIENFNRCQPSEPVQISLPDSWHSEDAGRSYLELTCLSEHGLFLGGLIATEQPKIREVSLGIVTCTFKKEAYVKNTVNSILKDEFLQDNNLKIFVVDNGKTLKKDELDHPRVELIPNRNVGGSGGFTRGLIAALQDNAHTHFLFMDDDIEIDSESIYRLFALYEYTHHEFAVASSMLDFYKKHIVHEAGALYSKYRDDQGKYHFNPFTIASLKHNLNLENSNSINSLLLDEKPDYGGFWFFAFSKNILEEIGLIMPFFIKGDDIEFCLRIKGNLGLVVFPGIAVWHEPFYSKNPFWDAYYGTRNNLVTHSIHGSLKYTDVSKFVTKGLLQCIFFFDYNTARMLIEGFEDYMKGPSFIENVDPEELHNSIVSLSKSYKSQSIKPYHPNHFNNHQLSQKSGNSILNKLIKAFTLNGHLLPDFFLSKDDALLKMGLGYGESWTKAFTKKRIVICRDGNSSMYEHEMNRQVVFELLIRWFKVVIKSATRWSSVKAEWRNAFNHLTSVNFWNKYLKLNEQVEQSVHR